MKKAIIQVIKKTYRTTENVDMHGRLHEVVQKIDAQTEETIIFGVPIMTKFSIDGEEKTIKFLGIPIKSSRRELWDHLRSEQP